MFNEIIQQISKDTDEATSICDLIKPFKQLCLWVDELPDIIPFYAIKCNPDFEIIKQLNKLGTGFDCASVGEIELAIKAGASPNKIIFAHPCKLISHIKKAKEFGIRIYTFDNMSELDKLKEHHPDCDVILRIYVDCSFSICQLSKKFGAHQESISDLAKRCKELELNLIGVSFHVGSPCLEAIAFYNAIKDAKTAWDICSSHGFKLNILDIGGGFPGIDTNGISPFKYCL